MSEDLSLIWSLFLLKCLLPLLKLVQFFGYVLEGPDELYVNFSSLIPHRTEEFVHASTWIFSSLKFFFPINPVLLLYSFCCWLISEFWKDIDSLWLLLHWGLTTLYHLLELLYFIDDLSAWLGVEVIGKFWPLGHIWQLSIGFLWPY